MTIIHITECYHWDCWRCAKASKLSIASLLSKKNFSLAFGEWIWLSSLFGVRSNLQCIRKQTHLCEPSLSPTKSLFQRRNSGLSAFCCCWGICAFASAVSKGVNGWKCTGNVVNRHQSWNPRISILSSKQLEVFEVLFGAYSSESLCQRGGFHY